MARRLFFLIMVAVPAMMLLSGCEQFKDYRKRAYYENALNLYESQQYRKALVQVSHALAFDEDYLDAVVLQGMCQYALKDFRSAAWTFDRAYVLDDSRLYLWLKSADAFYRAGLWGQSWRRTTILLQIDPRNSQVRYIDILCRLRSRQLRWWAPVENLLQPLLSDPAYSDRAFALLAEFHILNDNLELAEQLLMEHADANDEWNFVMRMLAQKYGALEDQQAQIRLYRKILELQPDSMQDVQDLLSLLRKYGRKQEEKQLLDSLIAADGKHANLKLIDFYIHYGNFAEAEEFIRTGLEEESEDIDYLRFLIKLYEKTNRYAAAIQVAKDVLGHLEEDSEELKLELMNILAWLYYKDNNLEMAKVVVRWILHLDGDDKRARFLQARISLDSGRTLLAISGLRRLASEDADNPEYDYYTGLAHMQRGETSNAEQSFHDVLKKDPTHKQALLKLSAIYIEKGFFPDVQQMINDFLAVYPNDPDALALQAELEEKLAVAPEAG